MGKSGGGGGSGGVGGFYAVRKGRNPGIYESWSSCERQVKGFSGAIYKKFSSREEALKFIKQTTASAVASATAVVVNSSRISHITGTTNSRNTLTSWSDYLVAFTDGACPGNGKGSKVVAASAVLFPQLYPKFQLAKKLPAFAWDNPTVPISPTNNRAELYAIHLACNQIDQILDESVLPEKNNKVLIYTDSMLVANTFTTWIHSWKANNWCRKSDNTPVLNVDLIKSLDERLTQLRINRNVSVTFKHVYAHGHSQDPVERLWNDRVDRLASFTANSE